MTHEARWIESSFLSHVPTKHYPEWVKQGLQEGMTVIDIVMTAFSSEEDYAEGFQYLDELSNLRYAGKVHPKTFKNKYMKAVDHLEKDGGDIPRSVQMQTFSET